MIDDWLDEWEAANLWGKSVCIMAISFALIFILMLWGPPYSQWKEKGRINRAEIRLCELRHTPDECVVMTITEITKERITKQ